MLISENKNIIDVLDTFSGANNGRFCAFKFVYEDLKDESEMKKKIDANFNLLTRLFDACEKITYGKVIDNA